MVRGGEAIMTKPKSMMKILSAVKLKIKRLAQENQELCS